MGSSFQTEKYRPYLQYPKQYNTVLKKGQCAKYLFTIKKSLRNRGFFCFDLKKIQVKIKFLSPIYAI